MALAMTITLMALPVTLCLRRACLRAARFFTLRASCRDLGIIDWHYALVFSPAFATIALFAIGSGFDIIDQRDCCSCAFLGSSVFSHSLAWTSASLRVLRLRCDDHGHHCARGAATQRLGADTVDGAGANFPTRFDSIGVVGYLARQVGSELHYSL